MRRGAAPFIIAVTLIIGLGYAYVANRLAPGLYVIKGIIGIPFVLIWLMPIIYWAGGRTAKGATGRAVQIASFVSMGFVSFLLVFTIGRDMLAAVLYWIASAADSGGQLSMGLANFGVALTSSVGAVVVLALSIISLLIGAAVAFLGPWVRSVDIPIRDLSPALAGLRIVQISDLHVGPTIGAGYVNRVVDLANDLRPDIVALTGDVVDGTIAELASAVACLARLKGRVYFVPGNHEYYWNAAAWCQHFATLGTTVLNNSQTAFHHGGAKVHVGGIADSAAGHFDKDNPPDIDAARPGSDGAAFKLLLAHRPETASKAAAAGFHLQLSGHTHGGQFFPWTWVIRFFHRHYLGLSKVGDTWIYVSPGTGTWGPPVRLGTKPEITLLRLVSV
jgi:uncharacterized protein